MSLQGFRRAAEEVVREAGAKIRAAHESRVNLLVESKGDEQHVDLVRCYAIMHCTPRASSLGCTSARAASSALCRSRLWIRNVRSSSSRS